MRQAPNTSNNEHKYTKISVPECVYCGRLNMIIAKLHIYSTIQQLIKLMSSSKYVQGTLTMPENMPLFNYNLNFQGLRNLIQTLNMQTNSNTEQLQYLKQQLATKLHTDKLHEQEQMLNHSVRLGLNSQKLIEGQETYADKNGRKEDQEMGNMEMYSHKMGKVGKILEHLVNTSLQHNDKINGDEHRHQKNIDQSFRRLDEKLTLSLDSMTKNINLYFAETNKKIAALETEQSTQKRQTTANFQSVNTALLQRISEPQLKASIAGLSQQIKSSIIKDLNDDQMKRLALMNEYSTKLQNHMTDSQLKAKGVKQLVKELQEKVIKSLPVQSFEIEKHKIFEKLSEYKNKIDDLSRKNQQFVDFRKNFYESNERVKHNMMEIEDQLKKLGEKGSNFKKMEDIGNVLSALDPHTICEIGNEVKLHEKQIGKLEKQMAYFESEIESARNGSSKAPQVNSGQTAELVIKLIKQYMANLDFDTRVKRVQKDVHEASRKNDGINQLEKKFYSLSKDIDIGAIMKEIKRKSDDETTKKDFKILDLKLQKLFQFYKQLRRDLQQFGKKSSRVTKDTGDNASLTTKKLYGANCLSCTVPARRPQSQRNERNYSRSKMDMSIGLDESVDQIKQSMYIRGTH